VSEGVPITVNDAETERAEHVAWIEDFNQRQQELTQRTHRVAFLNGYLEHASQVKVAPKK
jgi:hypothetical protein